MTFTLAKRRRGKDAERHVDGLPTPTPTSDEAVTAAPPALKMSAKPEAIAAFDAKLIARLKQEIDADRPPVLRMRIGRNYTTVCALAIAADRTLRLQIEEGTDRLKLDVPWKKLAVEDRRELADRLRRDLEPADHALAAFDRLLAGDTRAADKVLRRAGDGAAEVRAGFAAAAQ